MTHVLLAEDDPAIAEPLARALTREGYNVVVQGTGQGAVDAAGAADIVVLDLGLPDMDGLDVAREIRHKGLTTPVLVLTARADEVDLVVGLDAGADDYVTKPFRLAELLARVRALLRRSHGEPGDEEELAAQDVRVDVAAHRAFQGDRELHLTTKEFELLRVLVAGAGSVVGRDVLMREVWGSEPVGSTKTLDMHVSWLRRKLGDDANAPRYISTVRGLGFRFETEEELTPPVGELEDSGSSVRRRVLQATVAAVALAVVLLGFPLAFFGAQFVLDGEREDLDARVQRLGASIDGRLGRGEEIPDYLIEDAVQPSSSAIPAHVFVQLPDGTQLRAGEEVTGQVIEQPSRTDTSTVVTLTISYWDAYLRALQIVLLVVAASIVAFAAGIGMAVWQANRLSAPLVYLAASAEQIGSGQVRPRLEPSGVEEIDLVAAELARSSDRLAGRLAAERQFAADASHQLRTPLTALSMRLEEISMASDDAAVQEEARISLEQVERLVGVVDDLLSSSRRAHGGTTEAVDLLEVVHQQEEEWVPTFTKAGRSLAVDIPAQTQVLATPGALAQVLATLIENSLKHGDGTTTVRARPSGTSGAVVIEVTDEGAGVPDDLAPRIFEREVTSGAGTGLGLSLARDLAAADGGRLELAQRRPPVFALFLAGVPKRLDPRVVLPTGRAVPTPRRRRRRRG